MREAKKPSDLLGAILREARSRAGRSETERALAAALGPELAKRCRVTGAAAGRVTVEVDSAPLYAELHGFRREEIRLAMNQRLSGRKVSELAFRPGRSDDG